MRGQTKSPPRAHARASLIARDRVRGTTQLGSATPGEPRTASHFPGTERESSRSMPRPMVTEGLPAGATGLYEAFVPRRGPADSLCRARGRLLQQTEHRACTLPGSLRTAARILLPRDEVIDIVSI